MPRFGPALGELCKPDGALGGVDERQTCSSRTSGRWAVRRSANDGLAEAWTIRRQRALATADDSPSE